MGERLYLVLKSAMHRGNKLSEYELKKGDIIKFGRTKLLVRDINIVKRHEKIK
jgi:hypothetical protein